MHVQNPPNKAYETQYLYIKLLRYGEILILLESCTLEQLRRSVVRKCIKDYKGINLNMKPTHQLLRIH